MPWMPSGGGSDDGGGGGDVAIVGFGKSVEIFSSKQLPKKLTVFGDDFRTRAFVIKACPAAARLLRFRSLGLLRFFCSV